MPLHTSITIRTRAVIAAASMLVAGNCHAMGGEGFAQGVLIIVGSYILGVATLLLLWGSTKLAIWKWSLLTLVAAPFVLYAAAEPIGKWSEYRHAKAEARAKANNLQEFAAFCKDRKRVVDWQVAQAQAASLLIRRDERFPRNSDDFSAASIHQYMVKRPGWCEKTGLGHLEGVFLGAYTRGEGFAREVRTFGMCDLGGPRISVETAARFELVLGEKVETSETSGPSWSDTMSKVSVRLTDTRTGTLMAQSSIYILRYGEGTTVCPDGMEQLATLIADVFPK